MKQLKRREIESKLEQLRNLVGDGDAFKDIDIDGDFDPQQHDRIMEVHANLYFNLPLVLYTKQP